MNVLHISDIHFRESYLPCEEGYQGMLAAMQNPLIPLEECIQDAKARAAIDLVVVSGDLTEDGAPADYASLKQYLEKAFGSVPIVVTLGNHDIKRHFRQGWQGKSVETASDTPFNQVYETETLAIVTFDNSCYGYADGIVDERQFEWLQATLAQLKEKKIVFVTHHHLLPDQASTPAWAGANRLVALLQQYQISCILSGHTHHAFTGTIAGIPYYTVASMSFVGEDEGDGMVRFEERYGYNLYRFEEGALVHQSSENYRPNRVLMRVNMKG